jgi:hypothetical protein
MWSMGTRSGSGRALGQLGSQLLLEPADSPVVERRRSKHTFHGVALKSPKSCTHTYGNGYTTDHQVFRVVINGTLTVDVDCAAMVMTRVDGVS